MDNIAFSLTRVAKALSKKPAYRAVVQTNTVLGHEELAKRMAERTKQDAAYWKYIIDVLSTHEQRDALQVAVASTKEEHLLDDVVFVTGHVDELRAGACGLILDVLCCHTSFSFWVDTYYLTITLLFFFR